ncbi:hypothetical protein CMI47_14745, partial [Candidatus Pacearchaeota archaeon]|nr:hypothetical protein [Candidatus Pacearchaeota archaeon]
MKVYLPVYTSHAGRWIYKGFQNAWNHMGYEIYAPRSVEHDYYDNSDCGNVLEIPRAGGGLEWEEDFIIMATDSLVENIGPKFFIAAERSYKTFVFVQPNTFPSPWGTHLNFQCQASDRMIATLNEMENVILWTFGDVVPDYFYKWKEVHTIHLGFDSISYNPVKDTRYNKYDICFVGGWVNNGFDEKRKIMMDIFIEFKKSGLNCGFFVN